MFLFQYGTIQTCNRGLSAMQINNPKREKKKGDKFVVCAVVRTRVSMFSPALASFSFGSFGRLPPPSKHLQEVNSGQGSSVPRR